MRPLGSASLTDGWVVLGDDPRPRDYRADRRRAKAEVGALPLLSFFIAYALHDHAVISAVRRVSRAALVVGVSIGFCAGCTSPPRTSNLERVTSSSAPKPATTVATPPAAAPSPVPRFAHIVVVVLENHSYNQLIDNP
jgi:hypothetical protein